MCLASDNEVVNYIYCCCILDLAITNFTVVPGFFTGLETSCTDSDPYDNFTLTCTASKPALVLPELEVIWYHNGTVRNAVQNNNTYITNTINFPKSFANDSCIYTCVAKLVITNSSNITQQVNISIRRKILFTIFLLKELPILLLIYQCYCWANYCCYFIYCTSHCLYS